VADRPCQICGGTPRKGSIESITIRAINNADIPRNKHAQVMVKTDEGFICLVEMGNEKAEWNDANREKISSPLLPFV